MRSPPVISATHPLARHESERTEPAAPMRIGEVARRTGASQKAIRLYESLGLLGRVRRHGAYRSYTEGNVRQVQMIRRAQSLGFSLAEMQPVLGAKPDGPGCRVLLQQLDIKRRSMLQEIERLQQLETQVAQIIAGIQSCATEDTTIDFARCNPLGSPAAKVTDDTA